MRLYIGILVLLLPSSIAFGQTDRGTITGRIVDPAGAVVPNAPMDLINTQTGANYTAQSSATGNYTFAQLPVGRYQMTIAVPGFKTVVRENLGVQVAQTIRVDIILEVGTATESVTVTSEASMLKTENAALSTNVTTTQLNTLPILGIGNGTASSHGVRNPLAASQLQGGVFFAPNSQMRVNGAPSNTMAIRVDGQDATNGVVTFAQAEQQPSVDAIEEVALQTSNYAAEFGQAGSGLFNFTTKSGTNKYHGSVYDYFVNEALWASQPYNQIRPVQRRNDFGGTFGGPVRIPKLYDGHDKTFFFFNYEQFREKSTVNNFLDTVPIDAYRNGNFSSVLANTGRTIPGLATDALGNPLREGMIFDPLTDQTTSNGRARSQFLGNIIPVSRFDPSAVKVQNLVPKANNGSGLINNYVNPFPSSRVTPIPALKLDHTLNDKMKASFYWSTTETAVQYCQPLCGSEGFPLPITATRGTFIESYTLRANFDYTVAPTMLLHFGIGYLNVDFKDTGAVTNFDRVKALGIPGPQAGTNGGRFPVFSGLNGAGSQGGLQNLGPGAQSQSRENKPTGNISLSWVKDNHTFKFGGEIRLEGYPTKNFTNSNGNFAFSADQTGNPAAQGLNLSGRFLGFPYASFLLGNVNNVTLAQPPSGRAGRSFFSWFAQDTWKITRKLTLDYGLRWDLFTYPKEQYGRAPSFDPSLPNPSADGHPGAVVYEATCNCRFAKNYYGAYGPRTGLAYQISDKTVFRAGFGINYSMSQGALGQQGTGVGSTLSYSNPNYASSAMVLSQGIPLNPVWPDFRAGVLPVPGSVTGGQPPAVDSSFGRPARQYQWSVGLQREVIRDLVVEASYVANRGVWWQTNSLTNPNALQTNILAAQGLDWNSATDRTLLTRNVNDPRAGRFYNHYPYASFPGTATVAQSLRPFPQFGNILNSAALGKTWYDSLQLKVTKRFSRGLDLSANFTHSKELQSGVENDGGGATANDIFNRGINKQFSSFSRPNWMVLALNYTLPKWGENRLVNFIVSDWTAGAVLQYGSGQPIAAPATVTNNNTSTLLRGTWSTRVPGQPLYLVDINCHCFDPSRTQILNPAAWTDTPSGSFSPSARYYNDFRYRRIPQELLSVARNFRFRERATIMIRAEFNNAFNRTQNPNPSNSLSRTVPLADSLGRYTSGYGTINTTGNVAGQRQGTLVMRLTF
ncbi:MAG: TonB-dependent receptor [Bryobacteraceae bacterium]